jgi:hypothetical protein
LSAGGASLDGQSGREQPQHTRPPGTTSHERRRPNPTIVQRKKQQKETAKQYHYWEEEGERQQGMYVSEAFIFSANNVRRRSWVRSGLGTRDSGPTSRSFGGLVMCGRGRCRGSGIGIDRTGHRSLVSNLQMHRLNLLSRSSVFVCLCPAAYCTVPPPVSEFWSSYILGALCAGIH